jgi:hypothetical protein
MMTAAKGVMVRKRADERSFCGDGDEVRVADAV